MELLRQSPAVQRPRLCRGSLLLRHEQRRLHGAGGDTGCRPFAIISGLHVLEFPGQVWLLGDEWIDAASTGYRNLWNVATGSFPRKRSQAAGYVSCQRGKILRAVQRTVS